MKENIGKSVVDKMMEPRDADHHVRYFPSGGIYDERNPEPPRVVGTSYEEQNED
jgi:hypothetical protein